MSKPRRRLRINAIKALSLFLAFAWLASDALAAQSRAGSTRSGGSSSAGSSSGSGSSSSSTSSGSTSSSGAQRRSAVSRSSTSSRGSAGAARTRPHGTSRRYDRHRGSRHGYGYWGYPRYWNPYWGFWTFNYGYGPGYGYGYYPPLVYSNHRGYRMGALDFNVHPKNTEVYVDGQYVGLAKQYDGFPGHLWLEKGVYEVALYKPGFETQTRTVKILTDLILDLEIEMYEGQAVKPEMQLEPPPSDEDADEYVRRSPPRREEAPAVEQSRMHFEVQPGNAVVYLDGNLLGTGDELAGLHAGLILSAGMHTLEVSREGFETLEQRIVVEPGEEIDLTFELRPVARAGA